MLRLLCAAFFLCGLVAMGRAPAQITLPIVHTWGDLQKAPKLTTVPVSGVKPGEVASKSATFQVGVSSDKTTTYGAVVLYFLGETGSSSPYTPEKCGDYNLRIDGKMQPPNDWSLSYGDNPNSKSPDGPLFYAQDVSFIAAGDHVLELIKPSEPGAQPRNKPEVLASKTVHVQGEPEAIWYPFWNTQAAIDGGASSDKDEMGERYAIVPVTNPQGDPSIPKPPLPQRYVNFPPPDFLLPHLFSDEPPGTHVDLKMADSTLIVKFDSQIVGFFPDDYFLTRWWLNGKLAVLDRTASRPGQTRILGIQNPHRVFQPAVFQASDRLPSFLLGTYVWLTNQVHFELTLKPQWLGAKRGDRIGVQVLFCPSGFAAVNTKRPPEYIREPWRKIPVLPPTNFPQASNKIDFIYSGDPAHPTGK